MFSCTNYTSVILYSPAPSSARCNSASGFSPPLNSTVATGGSSSTVARTPSIPFSAFSTCIRQCPHIIPSIRYFFSIVFSILFIGIGSLPSFFRALPPFAFSRRLFATTLTLLRAMAAPASIGFSRNPLSGKSTPAATGTPIRL